MIPFWAALSSWPSTLETNAVSSEVFRLFEEGLQARFNVAIAKFALFGLLDPLNGGFDVRQRDLHGWAVGGPSPPQLARNATRGL